MGYDLPPDEDDEEIDWEHPFFAAIKIPGWENPAVKLKQQREEREERDRELADLDDYERPGAYDQESPSKKPPRRDPEPAPPAPKMVYVDPETIPVPAWAKDNQVVNADADGIMGLFGAEKNEE